jgi:hypothetical protein
MPVAVLLAVVLDKGLEGDWHVELHCCVCCAAAYDAQELVCGSCSAQAAGNNCPTHGTEFVAWKCK